VNSLLVAPHRPAWRIVVESGTLAVMVRTDPAEPVSSLWVEPQLATPTTRRFSDPDWIFERKLDGVRTLAIRQRGRTRLYSRNRNDVSASYPEIVASLDEQVPGDDVVIDGEIVAFDGDRTSFSRLQQRIHVTDLNDIIATGVPVWFYVFDLLRNGRRDIRELRQLERKSLLAEVTDWSDALVYCEHTEADGEGLYAQAERLDWEGIIAKRADAFYRSGRTGQWLKMKRIRGQEFVVGGFTAPSGARVGLGALLIGYFDGGEFRYAGKVGTGFTASVLTQLHAQLRAMKRAAPAFVDPPREPTATWVEPSLVVQVAFGEWTDSGRLRHPSYQGLRTDKTAADVIREL
jgi:bifunctional non-homologous end joining protein LigD